MKDILLLLLLCFFSAKMNGQAVVLNEFMSKNNSTLQDEDGDFSDWIELYNTSNSSINLLNHTLSDDINNLDKWVFPEVYLLPHRYMLIFASEKNRTNTTELHTNFKIASSGEELFLTNNLGAIITQTNAVNLSINESYSRVPDGNINWLITDVSSPNDKQSL